MNPYPTHQAQPSVKKTRKWPWIVGILFAFLLGNLSGQAAGTTTTAASAPASAAPAYDTLPTYTPPTYDTPTPTTEAAPAPPAGPATTFSDGVYEVGTDIEAGRYKTTGPDGSGFIDSCYWERASNDSGEFDAIKANDNISGPGSITVKDGEFVKSNGGCVWTKQ